MTYAQAARKVGSASKKARKAVAAAERQAARHALSLTRASSRGRVKTATLQKNNWHPYARRHAVPLLPPEVINRQTGLLYSRWRLVEQPTLTGTAQFTVFNDAPYAEFLRGTKRMHRRPIDLHVIVLWRRKRDELLARKLGQINA